MDGIINDEVLDKLDTIKIYLIRIDSEKTLAEGIARIANLSIAPAYKLEDEDRIPTRDETYGQIRHSASLFKAILGYVGH